MKIRKSFYEAKIKMSFFVDFRKQGWNGSEDENKIQWTFVGSLFYAIVCITTIGQYRTIYSNP